MLNLKYLWGLRKSYLDHKIEVNWLFCLDRGHTMTGLIRSSVKRAVGSVVPPEEGAVCNSRTSIQMHLLSRIEEMEISGAIEFVVGCFYV